MTRKTIKLPPKTATEGEATPFKRKPARAGAVSPRLSRAAAEAARLAAPKPAPAAERTPRARPSRPGGDPKAPERSAPERPQRPRRPSPTSAEAAPAKPRPSRPATGDAEVPPPRPRRAVAPDGDDTAPRSGARRRNERDTPAAADNRRETAPRRQLSVWPGVTGPGIGETGGDTPAARPKPQVEGTSERPRRRADSEIADKPKWRPEAAADRPRRPGAEAARKPAERKPRPAAVATDAAPASDDPAAETRPPRRFADADQPRLSKRMSELGLCSRREADEWIEHGWVRVDGVVIDTLGTRIAPNARIEVDPAAKKHQSESVTILINKPIGYVSGQAEDGYEPAVVLVKPDKRWAEDTLPINFKAGHLRGLAPAGRLDIDSTGLLVLTQDGRVARALIGERSTVEKEYLVRVEGSLDDAGLKLLNHGLVLDDVKLKPAKVSWANEDQLRFVLREGRKRQIRRMCELVGLKVVGLKRVRIGSVVLGKLPLGEWRYLRPDERF